MIPPDSPGLGAELDEEEAPPPLQKTGTLMHPHPSSRPSLIDAAQNLESSFVEMDACILEGK